MPRNGAGAIRSLRRRAAAVVLRRAKRKAREKMEDIAFWRGFLKPEMDPNEYGQRTTKKYIEGDLKSKARAIRRGTVLAKLLRGKK